MVNYNCQRCGYNTNRKSAFKKHLLRKNLCESKLNEITRYVLLCTNGFEEIAKTYKDTAKTPPKVRQNTPKLAENISYICENCNRNFTRKDSLKKHLNGRCKKKNKQTDIEILKNLLEEKDKLINNLLQEIKNDKKENKKLIEQLIKLSNNTGNNNNNNINSHNKIIINAYGCENIEYITEKVLKKLVNKPGTAIPNLLKMIHFNDKYPENKNLKVTNIHDPYIKVHDGDAWKLKNKGDIIEDIIINKRDILDGAVVDQEQDQKYIDKLDRLDETINDKKNNFVEKSVKDVLFNFNYGVPLT